MAQLNLNDLVLVGDGPYIAVITKTWWDSTFERKAYRAHYVTKSGLMHCPDHTRCQSDNVGCPIHGQNVFTAKKLTPAEAAIFQEEGLISPAIALLAK